MQVVFHGSDPGLSGPVSPPSPVLRRARDASLESSVMILPGVGTVEVINSSLQESFDKAGAGVLNAS